MTRELLRAALDALVYHSDQTRPIHSTQMTIDALRAALAAPQPEPWMPIETAPKYTEVLVWREDSGPFIAKLTTPDAVVSPEEMEREGLDFPDDFEEWWSDAYGWQEGGEKPTHWKPLPSAPGAAPPAAPADMVMVPREPTPEMVRAIGRVIPQGPYDFAALAVYRAMIAAAPTPAVREPLTDEQIALAIFEARVGHSPFKRDGSTSFRIARAIERAHGIGGGSNG